MIEKSGEKWDVKAVDKTAPTLTNPGTQEILAFSRNLAVVEPAFGEYRNLWKAAKGPDFVCRSGDKGTRPVYSPCESSLTAEHAPVISVCSKFPVVDLPELGKSAATGPSRFAQETYQGNARIIGSFAHIVFKLTTATSGGV